MGLRRQGVRKTLKPCGRRAATLAGCTSSDYLKMTELWFKIIWVSGAPAGWLLGTPESSCGPRPRGLGWESCRSTAAVQPRPSGLGRSPAASRRAGTSAIQPIVLIVLVLPGTLEGFCLPPPPFGWHSGARCVGLGRGPPIPLMGHTGVAGARARTPGFRRQPPNRGFWPSRQRQVRAVLSRNRRESQIADFAF